MSAHLPFKYLTIILLLLMTGVACAQQAAPSCGTDDSLMIAYLEKISKRTDLTHARTHAGEMLEYRIAVDVEYKTAAQYNHDQEKIKEAVYKMFREASAIFEREMNIKLTVSFIHIWQEPEPYTLEFDYDYFTKVQNYWLEHRKEERDAVVGMSIRSGWFYGGYRMATSNLPSPNTTLLPDLLAHELGHTLGSPHTHSCSWPGGAIDHCEELEGANEACPSGSREVVNGTIMSYCRSKLTFHPFCRNLIREYAEGKVNPSFSLKPFTEKPAAPGLLTVLTKPGTANDFAPYFEWFASERAAQFRFQIATDEAFTQVVEDTVVNQAFHRSPGQSDGNYFARFRAENSHGSSEWSAPAAFSVSGWKSASLPPQFISLSRTSPGTISGSFRNLEGISSYQLEVQLPFSSEVYEITKQPDNQNIQRFSIQLPLKKDLYYALKFRVNRFGSWTEWSNWKELYATDFTTNILPDSTQPLSTRPLLALRQWVPDRGPEAYTGVFQVATDASFENIVFEQSFSNNEPNNSLSDKMVFVPSLEENTTYYVRSRMQLADLAPSGWEVSRMTTGSHDNRFAFLGTPAEVVQSTSYATADVLFNRFMKAGEHLYVFNFQGGYHRTSDLQTWKTYLPSTTKGQSPMYVGAFGAAPDGQTLTIDFMKNIAVQMTDDQYQKSFSATPLYMGYLQPMVYTKNEGYFFKSYEEGVIQVQNGVWTKHQNQPHVFRPVTLARDNRDRVWSMGDGGYTAYYENGQWTSQPQFPFWDGVSGMVFDEKDNCYVYGSFGVSVLNTATGSWDAIEALRPFPARKIVFDDSGNMWLASYRRTRWDAQKMDNFALVKYAEGKASVYSDGLNLLHEPFDIEYYKGKLLIMTTGGEIQSFDDRQILSFNPKRTYCPGEPLDLKLATNSTFAADNKTSVELHQSTSGKTVAWEITTHASQKLVAMLPDTLTEGRYSLAIRTTSPEITTYRSDEFEVLPANTCGEAKGVVLLQNRPNPFGASGTISFYLPQSEEVRLELFNLMGQRMEELKNGVLPQGWHTVDVNGTSLAAGLYVYRLKAGKITRSLKMIRK